MIAFFQALFILVQNYCLGWWRARRWWTFAGGTTSNAPPGGYFRGVEYYAKYIWGIGAGASLGGIISNVTPAILNVFVEYVGSSGSKARSLLCVFGGPDSVYAITFSDFFEMLDQAWWFMDNYVRMDWILCYLLAWIYLQIFFLLLRVVWWVVRFLIRNIIIRRLRKIVRKFA